MNPLRVVEIVRRMEQGRTQPFLVRTEDDRLYVAKGRSATAAGLAAEWVCAHLGVAAGLPIPPFALLDVPKELVEAFGAEAAELGAGIAFGSLLQGAVQELPAGRVARIGVELRRRLLAFDWWVENADRTLSERGGNPNLLWTEAGDGLWVIDHNLAFEAQFDERAFFATHVFRAEADALSGDWVEWQNMTGLLRAALPAFDEALADLPEQWNWIDPEATLPVGIDWPARRARLLARLDAGLGRLS